MPSSFYSSMLAGPNHGVITKSRRAVTSVLHSLHLPTATLGIFMSVTNNQAPPFPFCVRLVTLPSHFVILV
jgi:hypothetical protein